MPETKTHRLQDLLQGGESHFFLIDDVGVKRLNIKAIYDNSLVIHIPEGLQLHRILRGFIPLADRTGIYKVAGLVDPQYLNKASEQDIELKVDPSDISRVERRHSRRFTFEPAVEARVTLKPEGLPLMARMINLSSGGFHMQTAEQLRLDQAVLAEFELVSRGEVYSLEAEGTILYEIDVPEGYGYGVKLVEDTRDAALMRQMQDARDEAAYLVALIQRFTRRA